jgi:hypothetical protein
MTECYNYNYVIFLTECYNYVIIMTKCYNYVIFMTEYYYYVIFMTECHNYVIFMTEARKKPGVRWMLQACKIINDPCIALQLTHWLNVSCICEFLLHKQYTA